MITEEAKKEAAKELHARADGLEQASVDQYEEESASDFLRRTDTARCLRVAANFLEGNNAGGG